MSGFEENGLSSLPVSLLLCVFIASIAVTVGVKGLNRARSLRNEQRAIVYYEDFIKAAKQVSHGRLGESQRVRLGLEGCVILLDGNLVELRRGGEVLRSEYLPLPVKMFTARENKIRNGSYRLRLEEVDGVRRGAEDRNLVLEVEEVSG